jgi:hypothetical protein
MLAVNTSIEKEWAESVRNYKNEINQVVKKLKFNKTARMKIQRNTTMLSSIDVI